MYHLSDNVVWILMIYLKCKNCSIAVENAKQKQIAKLSLQNVKVYKYTGWLFVLRPLSYQQWISLSPCYDKPVKIPSPIHHYPTIFLNLARKFHIAGSNKYTPLVVQVSEFDADNN